MEIRGYEDFNKLVRGKNINFLIGSGASYPMYPTLSLGEKIPSFEEIVSNSGISDIAKKIMYVYYFNEIIEPMSEEIEETSLKNYKKFIECLYNFLQTESNELPKRINIFTTNYDLLFEKTFDNFLMVNPLIYFNDGSRGFFKRYISNKNYYLNVTHSGYNDNYRREVPTINLFKLHGSISWKIDKDKIIVNEHNEDIQELKKIVKKIDIAKLKEFIKKEDSEEFIKKLNENVSEIDFDKEELDCFFYKYNNIPIINPDKYKFFATVSEQHYYQLIRSFSYELERKQAVLIVFGFSFADEHIKNIFERSLLNPELQVIIISYEKEEQNNIKNIFRGYKNITFLPSEDKKGDFEYLLSLLGVKYGE